MSLALDKFNEINNDYSAACNNLRKIYDEIYTLSEFIRDRSPDGLAVPRIKLKDTYFSDALNAQKDDFNTPDIVFPLPFKFSDDRVCELRLTEINKGTKSSIRLEIGDVSAHLSRSTAARNLEFLDDAGMEIVHSEIVHAATEMIYQQLDPRVLSALRGDPNPVFTSSRKKIIEEDPQPHHP